jgi:hypothetical protein
MESIKIIQQRLVKEEPDDKLYKIIQIITYNYEKELHFKNQALTDH